jgi:hypothetical protein
LFEKDFVRTSTCVNVIGSQATAVPSHHLSPTTTNTMHLPAFRGLIYSAFAAVALIFVIGALGSLISCGKTDGFSAHSYTKTQATLWYVCSRTHTERSGDSVANCFSTTDSRLGCSAFKNSFRAAQGCYVITVLLLVACMLVGLWDHFYQKQMRKLPVDARLIYIVLTGAVVVFSLLSFSMALAIPRRRYCDGPAFSDQDDFSHGASAFLMFIAMLFGFGMAAASLIISPPKVVELDIVDVAVHMCDVAPQTVAVPETPAVPKAEPVADAYPPYSTTPMG